MRPRNQSSWEWRLEVFTSDSPGRTSQGMLTVEASKPSVASASRSPAVTDSTPYRSSVYFAQTRAPYLNGSDRVHEPTGGAGGAPCHPRDLCSRSRRRPRGAPYELFSPAVPGPVYLRKNKLELEVAPYPGAQGERERRAIAKLRSSDGPSEHHDSRVR